MSKIGNYEHSSNRLETVRGWLGSTNCTSEVRAYCISITNQLMNASQPLLEVEALRGFEGVREAFGESSSNLDI